LLVEADRNGFALSLLQEPTSAIGRLDWRERVTGIVIDALAEVERQAANPTGWRRWLRGTVTFLANTLPELALVATAAIILWKFIVDQEVPQLFQMSLIALVPLMVIIAFHLLVLLILPVRWPAIRGEFTRALQVRFHGELDRMYLSIPAEIAGALIEERRQMEVLLTDAKQVSDWLAERQHAAHVGEMYGSAPE
jgi:hypothetical protein